MRFYLDKSRGWLLRILEKMERLAKLGNRSLVSDLCGIGIPPHAHHGVPFGKCKSKHNLRVAPLSYCRR